MGLLAPEARHEADVPQTGEFGTRSGSLSAGKVVLDRSLLVSLLSTPRHSSCRAQDAPLQAARPRVPAGAASTLVTTLCGLPASQPLGGAFLQGCAGGASSSPTASVWVPRAEQGRPGLGPRAASPSPSSF